MNRLLPLALGVIVLGACHDAELVGPAPSSATQPSFTNNLPPPGARGITVMTRNLYLGAELGPLFNPTLPPGQVPLVVAQLFAEIRATNFPERAGRLADEIAAAQPHLVGLQEVELYRIQTPGDAFLPGGGTPATEVAIDFLQILLDSLEARGLHYLAVVADTNVDAEVPAATGQGPIGIQDIRLTDRDVILARADVPVSTPMHANYSARLILPVAGNPVPVLRGWSSAVATVAGNELRFVTTHLETQVAPLIQEAQTEQLIDVLRAETRPIILVGDFNSAANVLQTRSYGMLTGVGFIDSWAQKHPDDPGLTCCQAPDLLNGTSSFDQRLDIVFWRDAFSAETGRIVGGVHADIVGEEPSDRTPSSLWPSDHAGVVATFHVPPDVARN